MGEVVVLNAVRRSPRPSPAARRDGDGEIALFTGVRIERWDMDRPVRPDEPTERGGKGRRSRRRRG